MTSFAKLVQEVYYMGRGIAAKKVFTRTLQNSAVHRTRKLFLMLFIITCSRHVYAGTMMNFSAKGDTKYYVLVVV